MVVFYERISRRKNGNILQQDSQKKKNCSVLQEDFQKIFFLVLYNRIPGRKKVVLTEREHVLSKA